MKENCPDFTRLGWESWTQASPREYGNRLAPPPVVSQSHTQHHHVWIGVHFLEFLYMQSPVALALFCLTSLMHITLFTLIHVLCGSLVCSFSLPEQFYSECGLFTHSIGFGYYGTWFFLLTVPILPTTEGPQWVRNSVEDFQGLM